MKTNITTPLSLYLIRHGETEWALTGQHTGLTDIPLTANGESEARELGKHLRDIQFSHVLTSPLKRAQQTCALVGLNRVPEIEPDLVEWDYGDYEGKKSVNIRKERPDWNVFRDGCPNGEMPTQIRDLSSPELGLVVHAHPRVHPRNIKTFSYLKLLIPVMSN